MDIDKLIEAVRLCGSSPTIYQCEACAYYTGGDMGACIPEMTAQSADVLSALRGELEHVKRERDAAVECIQFIATYLELNSTKDIRKTIEAWKSGLKEG